MNTKVRTKKTKTDKSKSLGKRNMSNKTMTTSNTNNTNKNTISDVLNPKEYDTKTPLYIKYDPNDYKSFIMNKYTESTITGERERNNKRISPVIQDAIDAYNDWVTMRLPRQIKQPILMQSGEIFEFTDVQIHMPKNEHGATSENLYPSMARITQKSYFSAIDAKYVIYKVDDNGKRKYSSKSSNYYRIGTIPTMIGSVKCHLSQMSTEELKNQGECVYETLMPSLKDVMR